MTNLGARRRPSFRPRPLAVLIVGAAAVLGVPALVFGHATVSPRTSTPGAYERYVLRVPNERDVATTRVEMRFPAGLRVTSFSEVPGWILTTVTDSAGAITGAVWTGTLAPQRFVEFPFAAANPDTETQLVWPAYQTYSGESGEEVVEWIGPEGSDRPASSTRLAAATPTSGGSGTTFYMALGALLLSMVSLGLVLRR
jgi:uncharacterized protein YcnI